MKTMVDLFKKELEKESAITRKMLSRIPDEKLSWKPHAKSMDMKTLATHIAELPAWITMITTTTELDFEASPYTPTTIADSAALLSFFEDNLQKGYSELKDSNEDKMDDTWTIRSGNTIHDAATKHEMIRMTLNQITHHRAQLGVYLRLLDIALPASYGPSADEA